MNKEAEFLASILTLEVDLPRITVERTKVRSTSIPDNDAVFILWAVVHGSDLNKTILPDLIQPYIVRKSTAPILK
jgi:hypothetical protein